MSILTFLQRELVLCRQLQEMSKDLFDHAQAGQFADLDAVMQKRASVLQDLQDVDEQLRTSQESIALISSEEQTQGSTIAGQIAELLQEISAQDGATEKILQEQKDSVLEGLKNLNVGKSLDEQYRSAERGAGGSFVDVRE